MEIKKYEPPDLSKKIRIIAEVRGGILVALWSDKLTMDEVLVSLLDWDCNDEEDVINNEALDDEKAALHEIW
jgi:hypothetical protein